MDLFINGQYSTKSNKFYKTVLLFKTKISVQDILVLQKAINKLKTKTISKEVTQR